MTEDPKYRGSLNRANGCFVNYVMNVNCVMWSRFDRDCQTLISCVAYITLL